MKRNENLHPLSWQHHVGLVIARRIKKGVDKGANLSEIAQYTRAMWEGHLMPHFNLEESLLNPAMKRALPLSNLVTRMEKDHEAFRALLSRISENPTYESLGQFSELLTRHIRFEENELFPAAEIELDVTELNKIGESLMGAYEEKSPDWHNPFWKETP